MATCEIKNPPEFVLDVPRWDKSTRDNGIEMSKPIEAIFNNTVYNKAEIERLEGTLLKDITIPTGGWNNLSYTISAADIKTSSRVTIAYAFGSIPTAQKANIRGRLEAGKLVLVAAKLPTADIVVEEIHIVSLE